MSETHFTGPLWSAGGFITGPGLGQAGTHFSGPVSSELGFGLDDGVGEPGTHFTGPVFSAAGFVGFGVQVVTTQTIAADTAATSHVVPAVNGGAGSRLLVFVGWNRLTSTVTPTGGTYGATPLAQTNIRQGSESGLIIYTLEAPPGTEDVTINLDVASTVGIAALVLGNAGGLFSPEGSAGVATTVQDTATVAPGGAAIDGLVLTTGEQATPQAGQTVLANLQFGAGARSLAVSLKPGANGTTLGWNWTVSSGFLHDVVPVAPPP